jgi:hypothetical protein
MTEPKVAGNVAALRYPGELPLPLFPQQADQFDKRVRLVPFALKQGIRDDGERDGGTVTRNARQSWSSSMGKVMNGHSLSPVVTIVLVSAMLTVLGVPAGADEIYIPDNKPNTGSTRDPFPFDATAAWRYHLLIPARMLGDAPVRIMEVSVAFSESTIAWFAPQFQLRMAHTQRNSLSSIFRDNIGPSPVVLVDGPHSFKAVMDTWSPLGIRNGFNYDGRSNLVLEFRYKNRPETGIRAWTSSQLERCYLHAGHTTDPYNGIACGSQAHQRWGGLKVRLTVLDSEISGVGIPRPGGTMNLRLIAPSDGGLRYRVGTSLGTGPIPIGNRTIGLGFDAILGASLLGLLPTLFVDYSGTLDAQGEGIAKINILKDPLLIGVRLHSAFVTLNPSAPSGVQSISNTFSFTITK